uniref:Pyruvate carboxyltransferase domain-containing protein n=1 Tax=viral metagenome TaxID=1070528 RepID=A0A6C0IRD2_9ZZZZ
MATIIPKVYPKCIHSFNKWLNSNPEYIKIYKLIGSPTAFDVTLRDGIQGLSSMSFDEKVNIYNLIYKTHQPKNMEVGSIVSDRVLPIFSDSLSVYDYATTLKGTIMHNKKYSTNRLVTTDNWVLIPNEDQFNKIQTHLDMPNLSFITSVSEKFQLKNTKMTIDQSIQNIRNIMTRLDDSMNEFESIPKTKVYVSCISKCPVTKEEIEIDQIMETLVKVNQLNPDIICLSDTCGTLELDDFDTIMRRSRKLGIPLYKYGLHLHVPNGREVFVKSIMVGALLYGIRHFDVSMLGSGGCSVTMNKKDLAPNVSYEMFYRALVTYIMNVDKYQSTTINDYIFGINFQGV